MIEMAATSIRTGVNIRTAIRAALQEHLITCEERARQGCTRTEAWTRWLMPLKATLQGAQDAVARTSTPSPANTCINGDSTDTLVAAMLQDKIEGRTMGAASVTAPTRNRRGVGG